MRLFLALLLFSQTAGALEVGYSLLHHRARYDLADEARGWELRSNFGGNTERYKGDRWSVSFGVIYPRRTSPDPVIDTPRGCCGIVEALPPQAFVNLTHRWYSLPKWLGVRFWIGTGLAYREIHTCVHTLFLEAANHGVSRDPLCWDGSAEVSEKWAFHQSFGIKWGVAELSYEHDSTGRVSALNSGEDVFRLGFFARF